MAGKASRSRGIVVWVLAFLLLGATVNVAVAWGFAGFGNFKTLQMIAQPSRGDWLRPVPSSWPPSNYTVDPGPEMGLRFRAAAARIEGNNAEEVFYQYVLQYGFPLQSLEYRYLGAGGVIHSVAAQWGVSKPTWIPRRPGPYDWLPLLPIWPGFAINTIFHGTLLWLASLATPASRRRRRVKRGLCPACAYPVGSSAVCTECGKPVTPRPGTRKVEPASP